MTALPPILDMTGSSITEAQAKTWLTNLRAYLSGLLGTTGVAVDALSALGAIQADKSGRIPVALMPNVPYINGASFLGLSNFTVSGILAADTYNITAMFGSFGQMQTNSASYVPAYSFTILPAVSGTIRLKSTLRVATGTGTVYARLFKNAAQVNTWSTSGSISINIDVPISSGDVILIDHKTSVSTVYDSLDSLSIWGSKGLVEATAYKLVGA